MVVVSLKTGSVDWNAMFGGPSSSGQRIHTAEIQTDRTGSAGGPTKAAESEIDQAFAIARTPFPWFRVFFGNSLTNFFFCFNSAFFSSHFASS